MCQVEIWRKHCGCQWIGNVVPCLAVVADRRRNPTKRNCPPASQTTKEVRDNTACRDHGPPSEQAKLFDSLPSAYYSPMPGAGGSNVPATQQATRGTSRSTAAAPTTQQNTRGTLRSIAPNGPSEQFGLGIQYYVGAGSTKDNAQFDTRPDRAGAPLQGPETSNYRGEIYGYNMPNVNHYQADQSTAAQRAVFSKAPDGKSVKNSKKKT